MKKKKSLPGEFKRLAGMAPPLKQRLYFVGILTKYLKDKGIQPVVVGGHALEFYTFGAYATEDIDLVSPGYDIIDKLLKSWGFTKETRHWFNPGLRIAVEVPGSWLESESRSKVVEVEIEDLKAFLIGLEDLIVDRLNAYVHWKSAGDGEWARRLMNVHRKRIDWKYLESRCKSEGVHSALKKLEK